MFADIITLWILKSSNTTNMEEIKLNKKKHNLFNIIFVIAILILLFNIISNFKNNYTTKIINYANYIVGYGDTIWDIAEQYQLKGYDIRYIVDEICDKNKLKTDVIREGQVLLVPIYEK